MVPDKPAAEVAIDEALVRRLLTTQAKEMVPRAETVPLTKVAEGWDCEVWRVGRALAARLPRRSMAAPLVLNEQRALPVLASAIEPTGIRIPAPVFSGAPGSGYPWAWSMVPWIEGTRGIDVRRRDRSGWAEPLAAALAALHTQAPAGYPLNPFRGVPLSDRSDAVIERLVELRSAGALTGPEADAAASVWSDGLSVTPFHGPPVWIHGDLHPANLVANGPRLAGIIDFGDVTAGDPAYDLAVAWLAFDDDGRAQFIGATDGHYDTATWVRARAWAAAVGIMLLANSDDEPAFAALGREAFLEII